MGKGSSPRPFSVANEEYAARWDMIFGRDQKRQEALSKLADEAEKLSLETDEKKEDQK
jgi:hypothetical protein